MHAFSRLVLLALVLLTGLVSTADVRATTPVPTTIPAPTTTPVPTTTPALPGSQPIWAEGSSEPASVALFRHEFTTARALDAIALRIFADTRYEAWLNGTWLGRGPARFSLQRQEYDTLPAGTLQPGSHVLAVLVHYAPNKRRSESIRAGLQASLVQGSGAEASAITATSAEWQAIVSNAWNRNAAPIHVWNLIGPQELLDLRALPATWMTPGFDASAWPVASVLPTDTFPRLEPRSIPLLHFLPRAPQAVVERGLISPEATLLDFGRPRVTGQATQAIPLALPAGGPLLLEATTPLALTLTGTQPVMSTGTWQPLNDPRRPDVQQRTLDVPPGDYTLAVDVPSAGTALALSGTVQLDYTLTQGNDAGRRMLLGNPVPASNEAAPVVTLDGTRTQIVVPASDTPRYVVLDFGRTLHARPTLTASGPAGTIVDIGWDERLIDGRTLPAPGSQHPQWKQVDSWVLDSTPRALTTLDTRAGRYMQLIVWGPGRVLLSDVHAIEETLIDTVPGKFNSDDPLLNQIWQIGVDTLIPTMADAYADPWRERGLWWGDAFAALHANRTSTGDLTLWRRGMIQMHDARRPDGSLPPFTPANGEPSVLLDYSLLWIESIYRYWQLTGDTELVRTTLPTAARFLGYIEQYENSAGLLDIPPTALLSQLAASDSATPPALLTRPGARTEALAALATQAQQVTGGQLAALGPDDEQRVLDLARLVLIDWSGFFSRTGESTALNALYSATFGWMSEMEAATGGPRSAFYIERQNEVRSALNARLFLPDQGAYATSRFGSNFVTPSPQAQAWSLVYDVVPAAQQPAVTDALLDQMTPFLRPETGRPIVEIYGFFWVLEALGQQGRIPAALDLIREHYGALVAKGATAWWETFDSDERLDASLSHAWGGTPTWFLSRYVLGVQVDAPQRWTIAAQPGDLRLAGGVVPLPDGQALHVAWEVPGCGVLRLTADAPLGTSGLLVVPVDEGTPNDLRVVLNNAQVWPAASQGQTQATLTSRGLEIPVGGAPRYVLERQQPCPPVFLPLVRR